MRFLRSLLVRWPARRRQVLQVSQRLTLAFARPGLRLSHSLSASALYSSSRASCTRRLSISSCRPANSFPRLLRGSPSGHSSCVRPCWASPTTLQRQHSHSEGHSLCCSQWVVPSRSSPFCVGDIIDVTAAWSWARLAITSSISQRSPK